MAEDPDKTETSGPKSVEAAAPEKADKVENAGHGTSWRDTDLNRDIEEKSARFNNWLEEHGYERATSLHDEVQKSFDKLQLGSGTWNAEDKIKFKSEAKFSVLGKETEKGYFGSDKENFKTPKWMELSVYALSRDFIVNDTTGTTHNKGSMHFQGRAADVSLNANRHKTKADFDLFVANARLVSGLRVRDERKRPPPEKQEVWTGPHVHLDDKVGDSAGPRPERDAGARVRTPNDTLGTRIERFFGNAMRRFW
jgi:hypothetical protein